ncbi:hypothetical protein LJR255_004611 [Pararhizobium sp. LjRoot255]
MTFETLPATAPRLARPAIGSATLSVVVALYLLVVTNGTFWAKR